MKEMREIVDAFAELCAAGKPAALATVIATEGSAYRRPGARLLVAEDGRTWGGVSGGCLERDVVRRARIAITTGRPTTCRYNTTDDEELAGGAATGCGGTIDLFIQPLTERSAGPLPMMRRVLESRTPLSIATVVEAGPDAPARAGDCRTLDDNDPAWIGSADFGLSRSQASGELLFIEQLVPPQALVVFGAGPDAAPVVEIAKSLGWHVTVVGARPATDLTGRFASADVLRVTSSEDPTERVELPPDCAVVLMTHNFARDIRILTSLPKTLRYLGVLGPRHRTDEVLAEVPPDSRPDALFAPIGLDVGAETPQEIALAIIAEIQAVIRNATGGSLRDRPGPIHLDRPNAASASLPRQDRPWRSACPLP